MRYLQEEDEEKYKSHFSRFIKEGVTADSVSSCEHCTPMVVMVTFLPPMVVMVTFLPPL